MAKTYITRTHRDANGTRITTRYTAGEYLLGATGKHGALVMVLLTIARIALMIVMLPLRVMWELAKPAFTTKPRRRRR